MFSPRNWRRALPSAAPRDPLSEQSSHEVLGDTWPQSFSSHSKTVLDRGQMSPVCPQRWPWVPKITREGI